MTKFLALWKGLEVTKEKTIHNILIYGDSLTVVRQLTKAKGLISSSSPPLGQRAIIYALQFEKNEFQYILRQLNVEVEELAKKVAIWDKGNLK